MNIKPVIKKKFKALLNDLNKFKVHIVSVLDYKKWNDRKTIHSRTNILANDSEIDVGFKSMHQSIITKIKNYAC